MEVAKGTRELESVIKALEKRLFIRDELNRIQQDITVRMQEPAHETAGILSIAGSGRPEIYQWNSDRDVRLARHDTRFDHVVHLFHLEWFGMRAAAGALPGHKLAISSEQVLSTDCIQAILNHLHAADIRAVVVHGFSRQMAIFLRAIYSAGFDNIGLVWHGAPGMWVWQEERTLFFLAKEMLDRGILRRMHGMRGGTEGLIGSRAWVPQLLNIPPSYNGRKSHKSPSSKAVFCPSWNLVHKNLFSNIAAAVLSEKVEKVYVLADEMAVPEHMARKLTKLPKLDQVQMLQVMSTCDAVMNVSLVDCHPMVEMESLAAGTPALRGPLFLDALEDHPYVKLTEVTNPLSVAAIRTQLETLLAVPRREISELMSDYASRLTSLALDRYLEFTEEAA